MTRFDKSDIGNSVIYEGKNYDIVDVDEELQLFEIRPYFQPGAETKRVRIENCHYIPF